MMPKFVEVPTADWLATTKDAQRYRYLRTYAEYVTGLRVNWECVGVPDSSDAWIPDYTLDNAIDDAMKKVKK